MVNLLEKYKTIEGAARASRSRYSRRTEEYCFYRYQRADRTRYKLFWLNTHYLLVLMGAGGRFQNSILS